MAHLDLKRKDLISSQIYINGIWQHPSDKLTFKVFDPATDIPFYEVADSNIEDAIAATEAASLAFLTWRSVNAKERSKFLKKWYRLVIDNCEDLAQILSKEQGKPIAEARSEVYYGAAYIEWFAEQSVRITGDILAPLIEGKKQLVVREPIGVVAVITPWNFPLAMIARKVAPALAAGCTVVVKPAEDTPLTAIALIKLAQEAGIPQGVVNLLTTSRQRAPALVKAWLNDHRIRKISFTGSTAIGKYIASESSETLKKLSLELGGNAPFIVFDDAEIGAAVDGLIKGKFRNSGQTCVSPNRVYVQDDIYDIFLQQLKLKVETLRIGPWNFAESQIGPLINMKAITKIEAHIKDALANGAHIVSGGKRYKDNVAKGPHYFTPTILSNCKSSMVACCEETFGPLIPLIRFSTEDEVISAANNTRYGLAAYFYSSNVKRIDRVSKLLEAGVVAINDGAFASEAAPVGGIKESGYGREGSQYGMDDYMQMKYICQGNLD